MVTKIINIYHKDQSLKSLNFVVFNIPSLEYKDIPSLEYKGTIDFFNKCISVISKLTVALELDHSNLSLVILKFLLILKKSLILLNNSNSLIWFSKFNLGL